MMFTMFDRVLLYILAGAGTLALWVSIWMLWFAGVIVNRGLW